MEGLIRTIDWHFSEGKYQKNRCLGNAAGVPGPERSQMTEMMNKADFKKEKNTYREPREKIAPEIVRLHHEWDQVQVRYKNTCLETVKKDFGTSIPSADLIATVVKTV